jgi:hypothetical protein
LNLKGLNTETQFTWLRLTVNSTNQNTKALNPQGLGAALVTEEIGGD